MSKFPYRKVTDGQGCEYPNCEQLAVMVAGPADYKSDALFPVGVYCQTHGELVADQSYPEYIDTCPNCGCSHGVN